MNILYVKNPGGPTIGTATAPILEEERAKDLAPYVDSCGNVYDFAFGLNWAGQIRDHRTARYKTS